MKKNILPILATVLFFSSIQASAQVYKYIVLKNLSGVESGLSVNNLKLTFDGDVMTATQDGQTSTYQISSLEKMFFSMNPAAIKAVKNENTVISLDGANLRIDAPAGTVAHVFSTSGQRVMTTHIAADGAPIKLSSLQRGVYTVVAGKKSLKVLIK